MLRLALLLMMSTLLAGLAWATDTVPLLVAPATNRVDSPAMPSPAAPSSRQPIQVVFNPLRPGDNATTEPAVKPNGEPSDQTRSATTDESTTTTEPDALEPETPVRPELTPKMIALRDGIRRTLATYSKRRLNTRENTATEVMHACLAYGCDTQVGQAGSSSKLINGITALCWNSPCASYTPLTIAKGRVAARVGYGTQEHRSQLLAVLALARVPADYPMRIGENTQTVADLVESEKLGCRTGIDMSLKLVGLSWYHGDDSSWKNDLGETWSLERIVAEEVAKPIPAAAQGVYRLMGLSCALRRATADDERLSPSYTKLQEFIDGYHRYALSVQNEDGGWGPSFLATKTTSTDPTTQLRATGYVLQWLAISLPDTDLEDPKVVRSIEYTNRLLSSRRYSRGVQSLSTREIGAVMHALRALTVYDVRRFPVDDTVQAGTPSRQRTTTPPTAGAPILR